MKNVLILFFQLHCNQVHFQHGTLMVDVHTIRICFWILSMIPLQVRWKLFVKLWNFEYIIFLFIAINPYCRINTGTNTNLQDIQVNPTTAQITPNSNAPTSFTYECKECYKLSSPSSETFTLKAAYKYKSDSTNFKNYCVVDCKEIPFAVYYNTGTETACKGYLNHHFFFV